MQKDVVEEPAAAPPADEVMSVPRIALAEDLTGWNCAPCASHNPAWTAAINAVGVGTTVAPAYAHVWWPGSDDDPMYQYCEGMTGPQGDDDSIHNRVSTVGASYVPWAMIDGTQVATGQTQATYEAQFNAAAAIPARVAITTSGWVDTGGLTATINVEAKAVDMLEPGDYHLMVYLWENPVTGIGSGTNGETTFNWAVWRMLPDGLGSDMGWSGGAYPGDTFTYSGTVPIEASWDVAELGGTIFVQNFDTLAVEQAAVEQFDGPSVELTSPNPATAEQTLTGTVPITWNAHDTQDADATLDIAIDYSIDGGSTWLPIYSGTNNNDGTEPWDTTLFPDSPFYELRISATDSSANTAYSFPSAEYFSVDNTVDDRWFFQMEALNDPPSQDLDMKPAEHLIGNEWFQDAVVPQTWTGVSGAGDVTVGTYASQYVAGGMVDLAGDWMFSSYGRVFDTMSSTPDGHLYAKVYGDDGATKRLVATTGLDDELIGGYTTFHEFNWMYTIPGGTIINPGERVVVDVILSATAGAPDATYNSHMRNDIPVVGTITNDYTNTLTSDNQYETITEINANPNPPIFTEDFSSGAMPPPGWAYDVDGGGTQRWFNNPSNNAGGVAPPEAVFAYVNEVHTWHLYAGPIDTTGMTSVDFTWQHYFDDYGAGVTVKVQSSNDGATWTDSSWSYASGGGDLLERASATVTANVGIATTYIGFTVTGNAYQLDYWWIDDVMIQETASTSLAEQKWYTYIPAGETSYDFFVEAYRQNNAEGDDWLFEYSSDDISYAPLLTVNSATEQVWTTTMPVLTGPVYIKVTDTDRTSGNSALNSIYIDEMYIQATGPAKFIFAYDHPTTGSYVDPVLAPFVGSPYDIDIVTPGGPWPEWRFISFPAGVSGSPDVVLNDAINGDGGFTWDIVQWYDVSTGEWKSYNSNVPALSTLPNLDKTMGFWVHINGNTGDQYITTGMPGATPSGGTINLQPGWNLVGYPSLTDRSGDTTLPPEVTKLAVYNAAQPYNIQEVPLTTLLSADNAYWVYTPSATVWNVGA